MGTESELNGVTIAIDGWIEIGPPSADLDIGFIDVSSPVDGQLAEVELLQKERSVTHRPPVDRGMVNFNTALRHHLFEVPQFRL